MANRFWVGGTATWDGTAGSKWSTTSGGAGGSAVPTAADDVFFDANSTGTITLSGTTTDVARSINCTGFTSTISHPANVTWTIGDGTAGASNIALKLVSGMTYTKGNANTSATTFVTTSSTQQSIDCGGKTLGNTIISGAGGNLQFTSAFASANLTYSNGTLDFNDQTVTIAQLTSTTGTRTLTLRSSTITCTAAGGWTTSGTFASFDAGTSTINCSASSALFNGGGLTFNTVNMTGGTDAALQGGGTITNFTRTGTASNNSELVINSNVTITNMTLNSNSVINRLWVRSNTTGTSRTLTVANLVCTNVIDFMDINGVGAATWTTGASGATYFGDCGGNTGITTTTPATQTWSGTSGGNWSANAWTSRVPLPQDNVIIASAFSASQTITQNMQNSGADIDMSGSSGSPRLQPGLSLNMYGSLNLTNAASNSWSDGFNLNFRGRGTHTLNFGAVTPGGSAQIAIASPGGTYTLQSDLITTGTARTFTVTFGTFEANDFDISVSTFTTTGSPIIDMGSGVWTMLQTTAVAVWSVNTAATINNASGSTIVIGNASANTRIFTGAGKTYGTLQYTVAGSTGGLDISGGGSNSNTFAALKFSDASNARTLRFTAATTTTITNASGWQVSGTAGKLMTVTSITAANHTISCGSGVVSSDYLNLSRSQATGGSDFYAGANSTDSGNNSGWQFIAAPAASTFRPKVIFM